MRAAWQAQVDEAAASPWRARELVQRERELFPRFAAIYQRLRTLPRRVRRGLQRQWACSLAGVALLLTLQAPPSWAATFTAGTAAQLITAITTGNGNGEADTITLTADITLTAVHNRAYFADNGLPVITSQITIAGNGHTIQRQSGAADFRLLVVSKTGDLTLKDTTLSGGASSFSGGGLFNSGSLTLSNSTVSGNSARGSGGGIFNYGGSLTLSNSTVSGNSAGGVAGGIENLVGSLTLSNSTVSDNSAAGEFGGGVGGIENDGGSLTLSNLTPFYMFGYFWVIENDGGSLTLSNSTVSDNSAGTYAGGIGNFFGSLTLTNSTVSGNSAAGEFGGGGIFTFGGSLTLTRSLLSGNTASPGAEVVNYLNYLSTVAAADNLLGHSGVTTAQAFVGFTPDASNILATSDGSDPTALAAILDPILQNNGGPTLTHNLVGGSPAIDAAGPDCPPPATDQRGVARPVGAACDIGAVEFHLSGFFPPVGNLPVLNQVQAGPAIPVKFSLGGDEGLAIVAPGSPVSQQIACDTAVPVGDVARTVTAGGSSLSYDPSTAQYTYVWKTVTAWAGTCRQFMLRLIDGEAHVANFQFKQ